LWDSVAFFNGRKGVIVLIESHGFVDGFLLLFFEIVVIGRKVSLPLDRDEP
jgi:hypothetical protein